MAFVILCIAFFLPAGTFKYWEAWVYLGIIFICASGVILYFLRHDPGLLERRMKTREKVKKQMMLIKVGWILFLPIYILPGFDYYYDWSYIPLWLIILSDVMVLLGYLVVIKVFRENSYASRVIETGEEQRVISTGLYARVRHPMYTGMLIMYSFTPLALGSYWALIGIFFLYIIMIIRLFNEEKVLYDELPGYKEYLAKTRYRLIPGIW